MKYRFFSSLKINVASPHPTLVCIIGSSKQRIVCIFCLRLEIYVNKNYKITFYGLSAQNSNKTTKNKNKTIRSTKLQNVKHWFYLTDLCL